MRVIEGAQHHADVIVGVAGHVVMLAIAQADIAGMRILRLEPQPQSVRGVAGIDLRRYRRRGVVPRIDLVGYGEVRRVPPAPPVPAFRSSPARD